MITSNSIGSWTTMDFNSGVNNMPKYSRFLLHGGIIEATTANISSPEGNYTTLNVTFIDLCQAIEIATNTNSAAAKNVMLTGAIFIASVFFFV